MKSRLSLWLWVLALAAETVAQLGCVYPFTELPYGTGTYCAKCDTTCNACSGTSISSCASCPTDFTLNTATSTCVPPANSTVNTVVSQYHTYGFEKESTWGGGEANPFSGCGTITVLRGVSNDIIYTTHSLNTHYMVRIKVSLWWFSGTSAITIKLYNNLTPFTYLGGYQTNYTDSTNGNAGNIAGSAYNGSYCAAIATNVDFTITTSASNNNVKVKFTSASAYWGIR